MESRILFGLGRNDRYDSWDIENLKYIRRKSQCDLLEGLESLNDLSEAESYPSVNQFKESVEFELDDSAVFSTDHQAHVSKPRNSGLGLISSRNSKSSKMAKSSNSKDPKVSDSETSKPHLQLQHQSRGLDSNLNSRGSPCEALHDQNQNQSQLRTISGLSSNSSNEASELPEFPRKSSFDYFEETKFDDCYVLDVLTVRNESVFAETKVNTARATPTSTPTRPTSTDEELAEKIPGGKVPRFVRAKTRARRGSSGVSRLVGSLGYGSAESPSSGSSVSSVEDEGGNATTVSETRDGYNIRGNGLSDEELYKLRGPSYLGGSDGSRSVYSTSSDLDGQGHLRNRGLVVTPGGSSCPFCSDSSSTSSYYYLGQKMNDEIREMVIEEKMPSPYYVRLRRDLYNYTPPLPTPRNFGMDKQGQLVIDYSSNWAGLENYVKHLQIT